MVPKRPVSCLAALVLPVGLLLLLVALGIYGLKFFYQTDERIATSTEQTPTVSQTQKPSRFPTTVPTTTRILVATASTNAAKEDVFSVDETGTATRVEREGSLAPQNWKTQGITLMPPDEQLTGSSWHLTGNGWDVPLRTKGGSNWQDPVIWGMFASGRVAVVAYRTQRALLSVGKAGDLQVVDVLDDTLAPLAVQGRYAWFVQTSSTDGGLEQLPSGPSELVRISETGVRTSVAQDPGVILELVPSPASTTLAYLSSDGSLVIVHGDKLFSDIKTTRPLAWIDERFLLVSRGRSLGVIDVEDPKQVTLVSTLEQPIRAARLSTPSERSMVK